MAHEGMPMWRRCTYWSGVVLIAVALAALPSGAIVVSYVGGSALDGYVEDGRYFVTDHRHSAEVSESTWRAVYWVERLWPLSALVSGLSGLILAVYGMGPSWKPPPAPPAELPPWVLRACLVSAGITVAGAWLCWVVFHAPWTVMLVGWVLFCANSGRVVWLYTRSLRRQSNAES